MSKCNQSFHTNFTLRWLLVAAFFMSPLSMAAEETCQSFMVQGDQLILESSLGQISSGSLATIVLAIGAGESLSVNFSSSQMCLVLNDAVPAPNSARFVVNAQAQEVALQAKIAGTTDVWLRLSPAYQSELLLDRPVGEEIGLTDMEFLSDNSGVGAEDFFAEAIDYLELGQLQLDAPFAEVPRFGVQYDHYDQSVNKSAEGFVATQGTLGYDSLRRLTLIFSPSQGVVSISE
jgi:hypothetical protein